MASRPLHRIVPVYLLLVIALVACSPVPTGPAASPTPSLPPSPTVVPVKVTVNGEGLPQEEFDAELARYQQAQLTLGLDANPEQDTQVVLDDFIDQMLLAQNAILNGYVVDEAALQSRIDALAVQVGGAEALAAWESANGYTEAQFRSALRRQMAAAWMRDLIIATVPATAEQVHVKQILFYNAEEAQNVYALLQSGWDFNVLAEQYNPLTKGELGWFPRGYLEHPTIEEAAFALQPGQYSAVVESSIGFHILYLVERDPQHLLSPDALLALQEHALQDWLSLRRNESTIVVAP